MAQSGHKINSKSFYDEVYEANHPINYGGSEASFEGRTAALSSTLEKWLRRCNVASSSKIIEVGCGMGYLRTCHPNWHGIEYSSNAVKRAREVFGDQIQIREGDARDLPIDTASVDFLFTFAALEHVPEVERAFAEIHRVLRRGAVALIAPAWNCRPWTVKKLEIRPYSDLSLLEKVQKFLIPIRNNIGYRALISIPARIRRELVLVLTKNVSLEYKNLYPDFTLNDRYPHVSDDDAFISMDAHAALVWFRSKGYECISHPRFLDRIMVRGEEIVVRKP